MLTGQFMHTVDAKGRVFIPAKFRADLGSPVYITNFHDRGIRVYSLENWEKMMEMFSQFNAEDTPKRRRIMRKTFELEPDSQGRIIIPEELRSIARITEKCVAVGMGGWAEFWDPELMDGGDGEIVDQELFDSLKEIGFK